MAARGGYIRLSEVGCDAVYEFTRTPCGNNGKNTEAEFYCIDCEEYMCMLCIKHHNKFSMMKKHEVMDKAAMKTIGHQSNRPTLPTERCATHRENVINTYCPVHEEVGCGTCIALNHEYCQGISCIPDIAIGIKKTKAYKTIKSSIDTTHTQLRSMKSTFNADLDDLENEKDSVLKEIQTFRKELNQELDRMEQKAISDFKAKHKELTDQINANVKNIENMLTAFESSLHNLENVNLDNESKIFIHLKQGERNNTIGVQLIQALGAPKAREKLTFKKNKKFEKQIKNLKTLEDVPDEDIPNIAQNIPVQQLILSDEIDEYDDDFYN